MEDHDNKAPTIEFAALVVLGCIIGSLLVIVVGAARSFFT